MAELLFKFLKEDGGVFHGGKGKWHLPKGDRPGRWMPKLLNIEPCIRGYHLCREGDVLEWLGPALWIAEAKGERREQKDKIVVGQARLIKKVEAYNDENLKLFAADCAERVLHIFETAYPNDDRPRKSIEAVRLYAQGKITEQALDLAYAAARDAAAYAARAARDAAYAAAAYAARAARDAAYAAADAAAYAARPADAAADAAASAAYAAASAASAARAARDAAAYAARAARDAAAYAARAARDAAGTAAAAAAADAAADAAGTAAAAAERKWQTERFLEMVLEKE